MIDPKTLRLGNWISVPQAAEDFQIKFAFAQIKEISLGLDGTYIISYEWSGPIFGGLGFQEERLYARDIEPISLTMNILEDCGFEKAGEMTVEYREEHTIKSTIDYRLESPNPFYIRVIQYEDYITYNHEAKKLIKSLHELQNLFFALRNQELTLLAATEGRLDEK